MRRSPLEITTIVALFTISAICTLFAVYGFVCFCIFIVAPLFWR